MTSEVTNYKLPQNPFLRGISLSLSLLRSISPLSILFRILANQKRQKLVTHVKLKYNTSIDYTIAEIAAAAFEEPEIAAGVAAAWRAAAAEQASDQA